MPSTSGAVEASLTFVVLGRELGVALNPQDGTPSLSLHLDHPVTASAPLAPFFARSALPRKRVRSMAHLGRTGPSREGPQSGRKRTRLGAKADSRRDFAAQAGTRTNA